jgi:3-oxoacyl-[acyl-carrier-protein] synthase-3
MDVRNQCSGFLYMLAVADKFVRTGSARRVLVVGAEVHSTGLDLSTAGREVAVIFGDGAAAVVVGEEPDPSKGILTTHLHSEGKFAKKLMVEVPTSLCDPRVSPDMLTGPGSRLWPRMEGRYVFKHAVTRFPEVIHEALAATGHTVADIDLFIPHQANIRIIEAVAKGLGLPMEKMFVNLDRYGNTSAASIPIALAEAVDSGRVKVGDHIVIVAFGAGFTSGAVAIEWTADPARAIGVDERIRPEDVHIRPPLDWDSVDPIPPALAALMATPVGGREIDLDDVAPGEPARASQEVPA